MRELPQPDRDRVSTLTALVLMTYTLIRIVVLPPLEAEFAIFGLILRFELNATFVLLSLAAALAAAGSDWLIHSHPAMRAAKSRPEHWIIPGFAALGVGAIVTRLSEGPVLWVALILSAVLLIAVLMAEFIVLDPQDPRFDVASVGLSALAFFLLIGALYAVLTASLRAAFSIPLIFLSSFGVTWRMLRLHQVAGEANRYAFLSSLFIAQLAWGLHYWPLAPLREALLLGLLVYMANGLTLLHARGPLPRGRLIELSAVFIIGMTGILTLT